MKSRLLLLCLLSGAVLSAQNTTATISGTVLDNSGAVVPGVAIRVVNVDTNVERRTVSNAEGRYLVADIIPGTYRLTATFTGLKQLEREGIVLRVGDRVGLDLEMQVGAPTEHITVIGEVPMLRTEDSQSGLVVDRRRLEELPSGRNPLALAQLAPNVNGTSVQVGWSGDFRINGGRTAQAEYFIDGVPVTTGFHHEVPAAVPSMEAVAEVKVLTNGYSAEYGRLSGGAVVVVTRSGTNTLHGRVYEYFSTDKLNATDWNTNRLGGKKSPYHTHYFGGNLGGPVVLPKLYNGRDKTFFMVDYETSRSTSAGSLTLGSTPSALEREGDFSQSLDSKKAVNIYDPTTGRRDGTKVVRDLFPGNIIPASRISPLAKIYLQYYPQANRAPLAGSSHEQNYLGRTVTLGNPNRWTGRLDQNWNSRHTSQFSIAHYYRFTEAARWFSPLQEVAAKDSYSWTGSFGHTWIVDPTTLVSMRLGVVRNIQWDNDTVDSSVDSSSWGLSQEAMRLIGTTRGRVPSLNTNANLNTLGGGAVSDYRDLIYNGSISLQKLKGKHTIKFGVEHRRYFITTPKGGNLDLNTDRSVTAKVSPNDNSGSGFASFLLGVPVGGGGTQYAGPSVLQKFWGAYFQDDIKVSRNLTVNLGVRWDYEPPLTERFNRIYMWDPDYKWNMQTAAGWSWDNVLKQAGISSFQQPAWMSNGLYGRFAAAGTTEYPQRTLLNNHPYQFSPRLGMAWKFLPKTVMRFGYGINYMTVTGSEFLNGASQVSYGDAAYTQSTGSQDGGLTYVTSFANPFPGGLGYVGIPTNRSELNYSLVGGGLALQAPDAVAGYEHVVHMGIQRELGSGPGAWVIEVAYNGNFGRGLAWPSQGTHIMPDAYHILGPLGDKLNTMVDNPFYGIVTSTKERGAKQVRFGSLFMNNPMWGDVWTFGSPAGVSNYNAGYLQAEHRFGKGFTVLANYTISKLLNDVGTMDGQNSQGRQVDAHPQAGLPLGEIYGIAKTDISQKLLINYAFELPIGRGKRLLRDPQGFGANLLEKVVGGWHVAGTSTYRTGVPLVIEIPRTAPGKIGGNWWVINQGKSTRPLFTGQAYLNNVSGHDALIGSANRQYYFNPKAFRYPTGFEIGDIPSVISDLRAPGFSNWDFTVMKDFKVRERGTLQVRCEATNLLNHMNAAAPVVDMSKANFGVIEKAASGSRGLTVAARFTF